jgi:hypothetical protein
MNFINPVCQMHSIERYCTRQIKFLLFQQFSVLFCFVGKAYFIPLCHSSGQRKLILCQLWIRFRFDPLKKNFISLVLQFHFTVKNASHRMKQFYWSVCLQYYFLNTILHRNTISSFNVSDVLVTTFCQNY